VIGEVAVDRGLQVDEGTEHATLQATAGELGEETFNRIEPGRRGGVKWKVQRAWRASARP
jgi:hypothetical protein